MQILLLEKRNKIRLYKTKRNQNGAFAIGKTWSLDDIKQAEVIDVWRTSIKRRRLCLPSNNNTRLLGQSILNDFEQDLCMGCGTAARQARVSSQCGRRKVETIISMRYGPFGSLLSKSGLSAFLGQSTSVGQC